MVYYVLQYVEQRDFQGFLYYLWLDDKSNQWKLPGVTKR